ncbi:hypothetical protein BGI41_07830 [Methanobrevibacter sp. 87.7]|uniref:tetratricopeptide repeat protein n=1 Tax=Methanobrevibacter sp. 87.7 TaxID=387957 RepID=UPI000B508AE4|nr:hypothetical protein [Methanobrevibacter sp. 87.7]OWT32407.1 hypothetical protein BGI41_07830 [Methanobrevibacter sp. 87.7]
MERIEINRALKIFPSNLDLLLDKFDLYMFKDNSKQAKKVADEIAEKYPDIVDDYLNKKNDLLNDDLISFIVEDKPYNNDYILENDFFDKEDTEVDDEDLDDVDIEKIILDLFENASISTGKKNNININLNDLLSIFLFTDSDISSYKKDLLLNKLSVKDDFKLVDKKGNNIENYVSFYENNLKKLEDKAVNDESLYDKYKDEFIFKTIFDSYDEKYEDDITNIILKANLLFDHKKYLNVFGYLTEADKLLPKNINILLLKSGNLLFLEEFQDALKYANMALVLDKFNFIGWVFKAYAHLYLKDIFNALQSFNVALTLNKTDKSIWRLYELTLMSIGSYNLGLNINKQALTIFPEDEDLWSDRLFMLSEIKDTESDDYLKSLKYGKNSKFFNKSIVLSDYVDISYLTDIINFLFMKFEVF